MKAKVKKKTATVNQRSLHVVEELEEQFQTLQKKIARERDSYLVSCKKEVEVARKKMSAVQSELSNARSQAARAAVDARKSGTKSAKNQLKKTQAARQLLTETLGNAREVLLTAQRKLHEAKPFDRKLAARARLLEKFEREWDKKMKEEAAERTSRAKKAAAKRRKKAKSRAASKSTTGKAGSSSAVR